MFFTAWSLTFRKEHWLGTIKVTLKINKKQSTAYLTCQQSDSNWIFFLKYVLILYYPGPNLLTLKVAIYIKMLMKKKKNTTNKKLIEGITMNLNGTFTL